MGYKSRKREIEKHPQVLLQKVIDGRKGGKNLYKTCHPCSGRRSATLMLSIDLICYCQRKRIQFILRLLLPKGGKNLHKKHRPVEDNLQLQCSVLLICYRQIEWIQFFWGFYSRKEAGSSTKSPIQWKGDLQLQCSTVLICYCQIKRIQFILKLLLPDPGAVPPRVMVRLTNSWNTKGRKGS